jgi:hypothetical protein
MSTDSTAPPLASSLPRICTRPSPPACRSVEAAPRRHGRQRPRRAAVAAGRCGRCGGVSQRRATEQQHLAVERNGGRERPRCVEVRAPRQGAGGRIELEHAGQRPSGGAQACLASDSFRRSPLARPYTEAASFAFGRWRSNWASDPAGVPLECRRRLTSLLPRNDHDQPDVYVRRSRLQANAYGA